jgi:protein-S-isoprenylcysteine O-methyltransferase Ste14
VGQSSALTAKAFLGLVNLLAVMAVALFLSAGTWRYGLGWIFLLEFFACALTVTISLIRHDPALLQRRVAAGPAAEGRTRQKVIQAIAGLAFLSIIVVPALDRRLGWSPVPVPGVVLGQLLVAVGFLIVFRVFRANSFASATIEVAREQKVIDTGPYSRVRHPMYAGALVLLAGTPLALGSFWGTLVLFPFTAVIVWRLLDEEQFLVKDLPGYEAYLRKVRFRLIPGVW